MHAVNLDYSSYSNQGPHVHRMTRDIHPLNNWGQVDNQSVWCYSGLKWMQLKQLQLNTQPFDTPHQGWSTAVARPILYTH